MTGSSEERCTTNVQMGTLSGHFSSVPRMADPAAGSFVAAGFVLRLTVGILMQSAEKVVLTCSFTVGATGFEPVTSAL